MARMTRKQYKERGQKAAATRRRNKALLEAKNAGEAAVPVEPVESMLSLREQELHQRRSDVAYAKMQLSACESALRRAELELKLQAASVLSEGS